MSLIMLGRNCYYKAEKVQLPGTDQVLIELIQARGITSCSETHKLIHSIQNEKEGIFDVPIYKKEDENLTTVIIKEYHSYQLHTKCYPAFFSRLTLQSHLHVVHPMFTNEALGTESGWYNHYFWCGRNATNKILVQFKFIVDYLDYLMMLSQLHRL